MARVLLCDDSAFMRMMLKTTLVGLGHRIVGEAGDGEQAVERYEELLPDLVTMDITMPNVSGIEAVKRIRAKDQDACIVMVSALGQQAIMNEALEAGAKDFIVKPFVPEQIAAVLERVLNPKKPA
nr:response regulator [uncultured Anaeromusa sp.]